MIYRRFSFLIIIRIVLLMANVIVIALIFGDKRLFFNQIILSIVLAIQVYELIRFVNYTNRELTKFFYAIRHSDFSLSFRQSVFGKSFKDLHESMREIMQAYKQVKIEKEAQLHFLQMLVNQLHIGIIAVGANDNITLINPTAEAMLGIPGLKNWKILKSHNPVIASELENLGDNGRKLIELRSAADTYFFSADIRTSIVLDQPVRLITLQNINSEIEQKEIEAWHKLIRILTHEIMNSVTPISSLTETMQSLLAGRGEDPMKPLPSETISDIRFSLQTIQKRSDGLLHFVENYRKLTKVPKPQPETVALGSFLQSIERLMSDELHRKGIALHVEAPEAITLKIDPALIEQVLINLIANSVHAVENTETPVITLNGYEQESQVIIEVTDNGRGIPPKELSEIFIPFFSTRKDGSGIGLSLSKQIMSQHGGTIKVRSEVNSGTSFYLTFTTQR